MIVIHARDNALAQAEMSNNKKRSKMITTMKKKNTLMTPCGIEDLRLLFEGRIRSEAYLQGEHQQRRQCLNDLDNTSQEALCQLQEHRPPKAPPPTPPTDQCAWGWTCQIYALTQARVGEDYVRLMCQRIVRARNCVNGFVRQVSNIDVPPLRSCVRLMCNTRR